MAEKVRKKKIKKEKISKKKKIKEISKEKLKKFGEELKEKEFELIKKPEGESQRIQEESVIHLEEFLRNVRAPVLERVAIAEETQSTTGIIQASDRETETQEETNYASTSSNYTNITTPNQGTTDNNIQYTEVISTFRDSQDNKERRETRAMIRRDDYSVGSEQTNFERTINPEIKDDAAETRKYFTKGDQK